MTKNRLTTHEAAERLGVCPQRISHRLKQGHFPNHERCECGRSIMIPESDLDAPAPVDGRKNPKRKKANTNE